jgi:hypothetical protein
MTARAPKFWWAIAVAVLVCASALLYFLSRPRPDVITNEREARASCEIALRSHLQDMKRQKEEWDIATVRFDSSTDRWHCTLEGAGGKRLYIILKPKTGGFEVSASDR